MEASSLYRIAQELKKIDVRIESVGESAGHVVVLVGKNATYRSRLLTEQGAVSVKRFLVRLREREGEQLATPSGRRRGQYEAPTDRLVERHNKRHPNLSKEAVRETIQDLGNGWDESVLHEELTRRSYTKVLERHLRSGAWGVLITTQEDGTVCGACQDFHEVAYSIRRALRDKPLPNRSCKNQSCRCSYLPVFREDDLYEEVPRRTL
ncbi:MAG: hypothetical protein ABEK84_03475 [Salinibacter sp.]